MKVLRYWLAASLVALAGTSVPAQAQQAPKKLMVALGSTSFAWLPFYVAQGAGYFRQEGLEIEITNVAANATPIAAIMSKSADIAGIGVQAAFAAADKKQPVKILTPMTTEFTSLIFARKGVMEKKGVTAQSPLKDRVKAMAGLKLATTAVGAGPDLMYRFLFAKYGDGMSAEKDARVVPVGDARNTLAAIKNGAVDVAAFSPPVPEKAIGDGDAEMLIDTINGEIPETRGMVYTALAVTTEKIRTDAPALEAFVRAIDRANKLIYSDVEAAGKAARSFMASMDPKLYETSVKAMVPATPKSPAVSIEGLKVNMNILKTGGYNYNVDYEALVANDLVQRALSAKK